MELLEKNQSYCPSLTSYKRRKTREVNIGGIPVGGDNPIRVQSMTTVDTMDTEGSIAQIKRMVDAGCEYVRLTAPSNKQARNLRNIKDGLRKLGIDVPLIADIHFTPKAAEIAAGIVEKVRINPGNYADRKNFDVIEYTDEQYQEELDRIREKFVPLINVCKKHGTAMRIGTNHGSLSDRILSQYGDTPLGMVESALEFLRIAEDEGYFDIVLSMKASNPQVMIQAYRLLVNRMDEEGLQPYPLHLGVTEAGEGEDGRVKSALGIGTLLEDGLGDTVRVSLTEEPEYEAPVAQMLVDRYNDRAGHKQIKDIDVLPYDPFSYTKRETRETGNFGGDQVPRVISDMSRVDQWEYKKLKEIGHSYLPELDKWGMNEQGADYVFTGENPIPFMLPNGLKEIRNFKVWKESNDENKFPLFTEEEFNSSSLRHPELNFVKMDSSVLEADPLEKLNQPGVVWVISSENSHRQAELRRFFCELHTLNIDIPVIFWGDISRLSDEQAQMYVSTDFGGLLTDGFGNGIWLAGDNHIMINSLSFNVLQASRTRISKTEYISCPSCGRTLFDLQSTTAMIRKRTDHLKGLKIGIMGCIVNGPGEMADADYGYVGSGIGKITLYRGQEVVKRGVPFKDAVDELIEIIREDGNWVEP